MLLYAYSLSLHRKVHRRITSMPIFLSERLPRETTLTFLSFAILPKILLIGIFQLLRVRYQLGSSGPQCPAQFRHSLK
jgi:hypothetical protein